MKNVMRDMGTQTYIWSGFSGIIAWLSEQQNLMILSLAIGIVTACANLYQRCDEGKAKRRERERAEEAHQIRMQIYRVRAERLSNEQAKKTR
ncbi:hypothetical protein [Glaesserella parasuis]|uniref:Hemophilus-specific protein n=1 Tax=Glaesserella parasuis ZJ0906 TaxID=1322346 RepID=A0A806J8M7_GLAPU|nr:hypothetical protein [Glaesserella parasuis]AGO16006.1 hypothetical protein K756_03935 [Glaesserella parasuis ZJ0906]EYE72385.1 hypothetical protein HPNK_04137 [Glaesserella parasuis str. Nagasaki]KDD79188.1 hypothetical protein HPS42_10845 [Glaesserella parasuis ST4-2]MCT8534490.1 hypothetical protein [Glaesserella parasuis]MCT8552027.1 hypothetical protein [Glaesserella parasuis]